MASICRDQFMSKLDEGFSETRDIEFEKRYWIGVWDRNIKHRHCPFLRTHLSKRGNTVIRWSMIFSKTLFAFVPWAGMSADMSSSWRKFWFGNVTGIWALWCEYIGLGPWFVGSCGSKICEQDIPTIVIQKQMCSEAFGHGSAFLFNPTECVNIHSWVWLTQEQEQISVGPELAWNMNTF